MPLGFGITGCGMIARFHGRAIAEIPNARLVALHGRDAARPAELARELGSDAACYQDYSAFLRHPGLDAVVVCTPSGAHLEPAVAAARAGKHVVVEKPLEVTIDRCDAIIAACDTAGVRLATILPSRFMDAPRAVRAAVEAGRFGRLTLCEARCPWWRTQEYYDSAAWRGTWALDGGGALMNQAIHTIDLMLWFMGPVAEVSAVTATLAHDRIEVEDTAVAVVRFRSGALGQITATTSAYPGRPRMIAVSGDRGTAIVENDQLATWSFADERPDDAALLARLSTAPAVNGGAADPKAISHEYHRRQLADFVEAVETGRPPEVDGPEGRRSVELISALYGVARTREFTPVA